MIRDCRINARMLVDMVECHGYLDELKRVTEVYGDSISSDRWRQIFQGRLLEVRAILRLTNPDVYMVVV